MKVVLRHPSGVEPGSFGVHDLFDRQPVALLRAALIQQSGEETESFSAHIASSNFGCPACDARPGMAAIN